MEIDKAITQSDDERLKTKYKNAIFVIRRALALYSIEEVAFSFNGGKDSTVLLHLLRAGHYLHQKGESHTNQGGPIDHVEFPMRTIYFETASTFTEINSFTYETASTYGLQMDIIRLDFKSGLEALLKANPVKAIFLGVRIGDPTAVGQEQFSPSSPGWPPFMRVNPILDWSYRDVWAFLLTSKVQYCSLYDQGYTSIGSIHDTVPNDLLCTRNTKDGKISFKPAYLLPDGRLERAGRARKSSAPASAKSTAVSNGDAKAVDINHNILFTASVIAVGDEFLSGTVEDKLGASLCKKLHTLGWAVSQISIVRNDVFIYGAVGPLHSDVTVAGVAKAFGVRTMAQLPEGITELLHHEKLLMPLIKCLNVIVLSATNIAELDVQWNCLIELKRSSGLLVSEPFASKRLMLTVSDVKAAQPLSKLRLEFPDLYIGCYRESRDGPLIVSLQGKDQARTEAAAEALRKKLESGVLH
ncbi:uncharacterized protein LOC108223549 isoform X4 [Daucus carota subsp. sativus]|uniref:uncharacterized protein LOC108223549 isoform X4 n=1 Tax=Daucus carota subsp. sativus TaxID=79200 RepID=UPI0030839E41